jgi:hypothetical protein
MNWVWTFIDRFSEWLFRVRTLEATLVRTGALIVIAAVGIGWVVEGQLGSVRFRISTSEGPAEQLTTYAFWLGSSLIAAGITIALVRMGHQYVHDRRRKTLIVELRGLRQTPDTPLLQAPLRGVGSAREEVLVDLRQGVRDGDIVAPSRALRMLCQVPDRLRAASAGLDRTKVRVVVGGLAPVPFLVLAGMLVDDESDVMLVDWDRSAKKWCVPQGDDDGEQFDIAGLDQLPNPVREVVLVVSVSYAVDLRAIAATFSDLPIVTCALPNPRLDSHWAMGKQVRLTRQFRDVLNALTNRHTELVHIILACPASLAVHFGMGYDRRNMPRALVYQYERSNDPPYPWAVMLPTHGMQQAEIVTRTSHVVAAV